MELLTNALKARIPGIHLRSLEERRALETILNSVQEINTVSKDKKELWIWTLNAKGAFRVNPKSTKWELEPIGDDTISFDQAMDKFNSLGDNETNPRIVFCLLDPWDSLTQAINLRILRDSLANSRANGQCIILLGKSWQIPEEIQQDVMILDINLPTVDEIIYYIGALCDQYVQRFGGKIKVEKDIIPEFAKVCSGLTFNEIKNIVSLSIVEYKEISPKCIALANDNKKQIVSRDGTLYFEELLKSIDDIGGMGNLKRWIFRRKKTNQDAAQKKGIYNPKGVLLIGPPGTGKSACSKAISTIFNVPLLTLNMDRILNKWVGESESNMRKAFKTAEACAPCCLRIDEIDKAFAADTSGVGTKLLGQILTWMQEKTARVFIIATANSIENLPAPLFRKGRFNALFFVDMPGLSARRDIFKIYLKKCKFEISDKDLNILAQKTDNYNGAEIEDIVQDALIEAFDADRDMVIDDLLRAISEATPIAITMSEQVDAIRKWAKDKKAQMADLPEKAEKKGGLSLPDLDLN